MFNDESSMENFHFIKRQMLINILHDYIDKNELGMNISVKISDQNELKKLKYNKKN